MAASEQSGGNGQNGWAEREAAIALAERYRLNFIPLEEYPVDYSLVQALPVDLMLRNKFVPVRRENGHMVIAMADPSDLMLLDELKAQLRVSLKVEVATWSAIESVLRKGDASQRVLQEATEGFRAALVKETEQGEEVLDLDRLSGDEMSPIIKLVDTIVFTALEKRASDIHLETRDTDMIVRYRIDGALYEAGDPIDIRHHQTIISRIKVMSELDIAERRVPQDGRFRMSIKGRRVDFRVSIMPSIHGEDAVIRILDKEQINEEFKDLKLEVVGFDPSLLTKFRRFIREPYGMVLVTGPTGSGKTTTLYAALNEIRNDEDKILTIEDPVEYQLRGVAQIQVNEKKGLTFARGLRSILRHDPDKIMVGEIRDQETAQIAINSALTGHLVFTTVHANNVLDVLGRFLNMGVEAYNFVSSLNCILAQRLVRTICEFCSRPVHITDQMLEESALNPEEWRGFPFREGGGCIECGGTGFRGRTAIHELLDLNDTIREMILEKRPTSEIRRSAQGMGMKFLRESALDRVRAGLTTLGEINKVTFIETGR
jgi:type IV pilus assembly protein PilB